MTTIPHHIEKMHARNVTAERRHDPHSGITLSPRILAFDHAEWHADIAIGARIWTTASEAHYHRADGTVVKEPKRRTKRINPVSEKQLERRATYAVKRSDALAAVNNRCQAQLYGCTYVASETHHMAGRVGPDADTQLLPVCRSCHVSITEHKVDDYALGLSIRRVS